MIRMFSDTDKYLPVADEVSKKVYNLLKDVFNKYIKQGYSIRDIDHVIHSEVSGLESWMALNYQFKQRNK